MWETRAAALRAIERARAGGGPQFLETLTYRFVGHSRSDPGRYRKPGELDAWQERDPLLVGPSQADRRLRHGRRRAIDAIDAEVEAEMNAVIERALAAPYPDPATPATAFKT